MPTGYFGGAPSRALSRDDILGMTSAGPTVTKLEVPEWGGHVYLREMTALERDRFETQLASERDGKPSAMRASATARLVGLCVCDEKGDRLFPAPADLEALGKMPVLGMQRVLRAIIRANGFEKGDVDELEADFGNGQVDA